MEQKTVKQIEPNIDLNNRTVTGYPSVLGVKDLGGDIIENGSFKKTIKERSSKIKWLWSHNFTLPPIAKIVDIQEIDRTQLPEHIRFNNPDATGGLKVTRQYFDNERANEVFNGIVEGAIDEMSIGFDVIKAEYPEENERVFRIIKEVKLYECSDVLWGMNDATSNAKSIDLIFAKLIKTENITDSDFEYLEKLFNDNKDLFFNLFVKVFGNEFEIIKKNDIIENVRSSKNSDELLRKILNNELFLVNF